ncbi:MAG: hypothetical protein GX941_02310 [Candidatus Methanofastidiosa archaeon]|nr:hypothetical protein [Candidatus Methanofastidiosa archaeon]HOM95289.1 hypothetical protein [Methanofastidiosum sp.]HPC80626.1 hypothetical protein [Methanofastidiosum sp.]HRS25124.1 hypothetical protein [Methanofastidiosum sp.]
MEIYDANTISNIGSPYIIKLPNISAEKRKYNPSEVIIGIATIKMKEKINKTNDGKV